MTGFKPCQLSCPGTQLRKEGYFHFCGFNRVFQSFFSFLPPLLPALLGFSVEPFAIESESSVVVVGERKRTDGAVCGGDTAVAEDLEVVITLITISLKNGGYCTA